MEHARVRVSPALAGSLCEAGCGLTLMGYACYGAGSRLMAGMGFHLGPDGTHHEVDGGVLDGQVGRNVRNTGFQLSSPVSCEPWRIAVGPWRAACITTAKRTNLPLVGALVNMRSSRHTPCLAVNAGLQWTCFARCRLRRCRAAHPADNSCYVIDIRQLADYDCTR
jgi:hypothetical protein